MGKTISNRFVAAFLLIVMTAVGFLLIQQVRAACYIDPCVDPSTGIRDQCFGLGDGGGAE